MPPDRPPAGVPGALHRMLRNTLSITGLVIFVATLVSFFFLLGVEYFTAEDHNPYLGLFHYLLLPPLGTLGLVLVVAGIWREGRRQRRGKPPGKVVGLWDLSRVEVRQQMLVVAGGLTAVSVFAMALGGYRAYEYTESTTFCGQVCHAVMEPEYTAYLHSPHAEIACSSCHVGPGPASYAAAKLNGLRMVYRTFTGTYSQPISTPIEHMIPARETCERCHWASFFFGDRLSTRKYYLSEDGEEPWEVNLLVHVGGGDPEHGYTSGIHWHMNLENVVEYIARDERLQDIPWVRATDAAGNATVYVDEDDPPSDELLRTGTIRRMDCTDCHNRPAHRFEAPVNLVNRELELGNLDPTAPEVKLLALEVLAEPYESTAAALQAIDERLHSFYAEEYPDYYEDNRDAVAEAVTTLQEVYRANFFPERGVRWDVYPDNIGHWFFPGCFRCHDGLHRSEDGTMLSASCETCHTIVGQGIGVEARRWNREGVAFVHPYDQEIMDEPILCHECHNGALGY